MIRDLVCRLVKVISGLNIRWECPSENKQRIYFANHTSHMDFVAIWSALPAPLRDQTRPVAARDYWTRGKFRQWVAQKVINAVLIERHAVSRHEGNPLKLMAEAMDQGCSLILFPEGFRNTSGVMQPFKSGLYHLHKRKPQVELIPVYLENLSRILPKGEFLPVPILGSVTFGKPLASREGETKQEFLDRARQSVEELNNDYAHS